MKINESLMSELDWIIDEYLEKAGKDADWIGCIHYVDKQIDTSKYDSAAFTRLVKKTFLTKIGRENEIEEALKIVKAFGYRVINEADEADEVEDEPEEVEDDPLDGEPDDIKTMVRELAEYTGNDYADANVDYNAGPGSLAVEVRFGNEEYSCYESYDEAEEAAQEDCKELFDDIGIEGIRFENIGGIESFVDEDWFDDAKKEDAEYYVSDIKESDPERYEEEFGDVDEDEAVEKYLENYYDGESIQWYIDNFGKKEFEKRVKENNLIDLDKLAEAIVNSDGPANSLARYDGDEISLDCGYYCYRTN